MITCCFPSSRTFCRAVNAGDCADAIANSTARDRGRIGSSLHSSAAAFRLRGDGFWPEGDFGRSVSGPR